MALNSAAISAGIAALTVAGVTIKDMSEIPNGAQGRDCPMMFPSPDNWISGGSGAASEEVGEGPATFGGSTAMWVFERTFNYLYLHASAGAGRGLADQIPSMATNLDAIMTALVGLNVTGVDVMQVDCSGFDVIVDPAGNKFYGFTLAVTLKERINA